MLNQSAKLVLGIVFSVLLFTTRGLAKETNKGGSDQLTSATLNSLTSKNSNFSAPSLKRLADCRISDNLPCARLYVTPSKADWALEVCSSQDDIQTGLYLHDSSGTRHFAWFDNDHFNWACSEKCTDSGCSYDIIEQSEGKIQKLKYKFDINLTHGTYDLKIQGDSMKILKKNQKDDPS